MIKQRPSPSLPESMDANTQRNLGVDSGRKLEKARRELCVANAEAGKSSRYREGLSRDLGSVWAAITGTYS